MPAYIGGEFDVAGLKWIPSVPDNPVPERPAARERARAPDRPRDRPPAGGDGRDGGLGHADGRRRRASRCGIWPTRTPRSPACWAPASWPTPSWLRCASSCPRLREVRVFDPATERCRRFCDRAAAQGGPDVRPAASAEEAVRGSRGRRAGDDGGRAQLRRGVDRPPARRCVLVSSLDGAARPAGRHRPPGGGRLGARVDPPRPLRPAAGRGRARPRRRIAGRGARRRRRRAPPRAHGRRRSGSSSRPSAWRWTTSPPPGTCSRAPAPAAWARRCGCGPGPPVWE